MFFIGEAYEILEKLGKGAYAKTYLALSPEGKKVVIKLPNLDLHRSFTDIEKRIEDFNKSLRAEYESLNRLARVRCVAHARHLGTHVQTVQKRKIFPHFIAQEYIEGLDLDAYLKNRNFGRATRPTNRRFRGIPLVAEFYSLASKIIDSLAQVHKNEVVHGDIWPRNIRVRPDGDVVIIDFGQSLIVDLVLDATGEPLSHRYAAPERREARTRWGAAADIYSLGGVLFFMATGEDPQVPPVIDWDELKDKVAERMKHSNPELYNANSGIADVIARCMRFLDRDRPSYPEAVLEELNVYLGARPTPKLSEALRALNNSVGKLKRSKNVVFAQIAGSRLRTIARQFEEMKDGLYTLGGHYENIARGLVDSLSLLEKGDTYLTVTIPSFWGKNSIGRNGRFLEMNKIVAQRGVNVARVFLLTEDDLESEDVRSVLDAHIRVVNELRQGKSVAPAGKWCEGSSKGFYTGVYVDRDGAKHGSLEFTNFGIWNKANSDEAVLILPAYREREKNIAAVRFWAKPTWPGSMTCPSAAPERIAKLREAATTLIAISTPLDEFLMTLRRVVSVSKAQERRREQARIQGDVRQAVPVTWRRTLRNGCPLAAHASATIRDYSLNGISLSLHLPRRKAPTVGDIMRLEGRPPFTGEWLRSLFGRELKVVWKDAHLRGPGNYAVGLQRVA